jgi:ParB family transcriptional regulator, chromosome partitioning protein
MPRERLSALVAEYIPMATPVQKITLSPSRDIPFNKLLLSQSNVRRVKAGVSIEELADDIARWKPTVDNFLGRVTKARIFQAVAEAKGQRAANRIEHLKKGDMAVEAEALLAGTNWLPEALRTPGQPASEPSKELSTEASVPEGVETAVAGYETAMVETGPSNEDEQTAIDPSLVAAE